MQDYHTNIAFNQLPLEAFSLDSQEPVKGARRVALRKAGHLHALDRCLAVH